MMGRRKFLRAFGTGGERAALNRFDASLRAAPVTDTQFQLDHLKPRYREKSRVTTFSRLSRRRSEPRPRRPQ
jgi:hypothetical protein